MTLLFISISGSIMLIFYFLLKYISSKFLSASWKYFFLKLTIIYYLVPVTWISSIFKKPVIHDDQPYYLDLNKVLQITPKSIIVYNKFTIINFLKVIIFGWLLFVIIFILKNFFKYLKIKKWLLMNSVQPNHAFIDLLADIKRYYKIKKNVTLKISEGINSPITFGIFKPVILIPVADFSLTELKMILSHEVIHIKQHDLVIKYLAIFITSLHWFNPLTYNIVSEVTYISELSCDDLLVKGCSIDQRKEYGRLILKVTDKTLFNKNIFISSLSQNGGECLERRISEMLFIKKPNKAAIFSFVMIFVLCNFASTATVLACNNIQMVYWDESAIFDYNMNTSNPIYSEETYDMSDYIFPYENMEVSEVKGYLKENNPFLEDTMDNINKSSCNHTYKNNSYIKHLKFKNGGCTLETYSAKYCTKCGNIIIEKLESSIYSRSCTH